MLPLILDMYAREKKDYLTSILMKDNNGDSPLDIAIQNDFTRNADLMISYLNIFGPDS